MAGRTKDASISFIRMIAMTFIVVCHIFQTYQNELCYWFNVGVQIFLIISGFLHSQKEYSKESSLDILKKQFKKILLPYYLWLFLVVLLYTFFSPNSLSISSIINSMFCSGSLVGQGHLWFIPYILFCYIITPYLYWIKNKIIDRTLLQSILLWLAILGLVLVVSSLYNSYFRPEILTCYILGYAVADLFNRFNKIKRKTTILVFLLALALNVIKICILYIYCLDFDGIELIAFSYFKSYSHVFLGLAIFLLLLYYGKKIKYSKIMLYSDKYSYEIYLVHALFILSPLNLLFWTDVVWINILASVCCTIICSVFLNVITAKIESINKKGKPDRL